MLFRRLLILKSLWTCLVLLLLLGTSGMGRADATAVDTSDGTAHRATAATATAACGKRLSMAEASKAAAASKAGGVGVERGGGRSRELATATNVTFLGDTSTAAPSAGNPNAACDIETDCVNGCPSLFYKVTGGNGSFVKASTCGTATFDQYFYVWQGNDEDGDACASFNCTEHTTVPCSTDSKSGRIWWKAQTGAAYYVQVWGYDDDGAPGGRGTYTLTVSSDAPIEVSQANVCTSPPPVTSFWLYDPTTNAPVRELANNSATCLLHPYNIEIRPNSAAIASTPVRVRLLNASGGPPLVVHKSKVQRSAPYFLFGPAPTNVDNVLPSPKPLRNGVYYLEAKGAPEWGRLRFTQNCPCSDGTLKKKGKKGCMK